MPFEHIFTTELPALVDLDDTNYSLGTLFKTDVPGLILGVRVYTSNFTASGTTGHLWRADSDTQGVQLARLDFGTLVPNSWNEKNFDSPVHINANQQYITGWTTHNYVATGGFFNAHQIQHGHITSPATAPGQSNGKYYVGGEAYPDQEFNGNCYFIDTIFLADGETAPSNRKNSFFFASA